MKRSVDAARISRARCAQHWPVLDVHSLSLSRFAVAQWRLEPNGLIGEERDHNADRLLSLSLSLQWGVWGHAELSAPWTASQCAVSLHRCCFRAVSKQSRARRLMPFLVTALWYCSVCCSAPPHCNWTRQGPSTSWYYLQHTIKMSDDPGLFPQRKARTFRQ